MFRRRIQAAGRKAHALLAIAEASDPRQSFPDTRCA